MFRDSHTSIRACEPCEPVTSLITAESPFFTDNVNGISLTSSGRKMSGFLFKWNRDIALKHLLLNPAVWDK
jgi:hypothetical protein